MSTKWRKFMKTCVHVLVFSCTHLHQDRHPKSLVRLRTCLPEPIKRERKEKEGKKKQQKNIEWDWNSGRQTVSLTHSSMGARSHRTDCTQTHIHTEPIKAWQGFVKASWTGKSTANTGSDGHRAHICTRAVHPPIRVRGGTTLEVVSPRT